MQKCAVAKVPFFIFFLSCYNQYVQQQYLANGLSTHRHLSTKLMLITARNSTTTQCLHSFKFTLVNKSHSQHSEAAVRCLGRHFLILYACAHGHWSGSETSTQARSPVGSTHGWYGLFLLPALGKAYEHHVGKALHSAAYL